MKDKIIEIFQKKEPLKIKYNELLAILNNRSATPDTKKKYFQNGFTPAKYEQLVNELCACYKIKPSELKSKVAAQVVKEDALDEEVINAALEDAVNEEEVKEDAVNEDIAETPEVPEPVAKKKPAKKAPKKNSKG